MLSKRRRGSPRAAVGFARAQTGPLPNCAQAKVLAELHLGYGSRAGPAPREGSSLSIPRPVSTQLQLQLSVTGAKKPCLSVFSPSAKFAQVRGRSAAERRPRALQRCPSRRPRRAARRGSRAAPRGSLSLLHLQDGRRRLHTSHQEARPPEPRFTRLRGHGEHGLGVRPRRPGTLFAARASCR